jgi:hypothetical protein
MYLARFELLGGVSISLKLRTLTSPPQIVMLYNSNDEAIKAFEDMRKQFSKLHLIKE